MNILRSILWTALNVVFWGTAWSSFFTILHLLWSSGDFTLSIFYSFVLASTLGSIVFALLEIKHLNRWRNLWIRGLLFWSGLWGIVFPLAVGLHWAIANRDCNCDGNLMCMCPSGNFWIALAIWYLYFWVVVPHFFTMALVGSVFWSWLFQRLVRRLF